MAAPENRVIDASKEERREGNDEADGAVHVVRLFSFPMRCIILKEITYSKSRKLDSAMAHIPFLQ